jgi:hypothetical protein
MNVRSLVALLTIKQGAMAHAPKSRQRIVTPRTFIQVNTNMLEYLSSLGVANAGMLESHAVPV